MASASQGLVRHQTPTIVSDLSSNSDTPSGSASGSAPSTPKSCKRCRRRSSPAQAPPNTPAMHCNSEIS